MAEHERLVEILKKNRGNKTYYATDDVISKIVDVLIANNVKVLPCKIGDSIWWIDNDTNEVKEEKNAITAIMTTNDKIFISTENLGTTVVGFDEINTDYAYITKEAAEAALKLKEHHKRTIKWTLETGFARCKYSGEFEVDVNMSEEEIENMAREEAFNEIDWSWWEEKNSDKK